MACVGATHVQALQGCAASQREQVGRSGAYDVQCTEVATQCKPVEAGDVAVISRQEGESGALGEGLEALNLGLVDVQVPELDACGERLDVSDIRVAQVEICYERASPQHVDVLQAGAVGRIEAAQAGDARECGEFHKPVIVVDVEVLECCVVGEGGEALHECAREVEANQERAVSQVVQVWQRQGCVGVASVCEVQRCEGTATVKGRHHG